MTRSYRLLASLLGLALSTQIGCVWLADSHNVAGVGHFQRGNTPAAIGEFQKALSAQPRNADAYYNLATAYHKQAADRQDKDLLSQSEQLYRQAIQYEPNHAHAYRGLAVIMSQTNRQDEAVVLLKNWALSSPKNSEAYVELARLHEEMGDATSARAYLNEALAKDVNNSRAWATIAKLREQEGNPQLALQSYQQAYRSNQMQPGVAQRIAALSQTAGSGGTTSGDTRMVNISVPPPR